MKLTKKFLTLAIAALMLLSLAVPAMADDFYEKFYEIDDFQIWEYHDPEEGTEVHLTKYDGPGGDVVIPDMVTNIATQAFAHCSSLTSVTIPSSVTCITTEAFWQCENLRSVIIPSSVTIIGEYAFAQCTGLTDIYFAGTEAQWVGFEKANADMGYSDSIFYEAATPTIHYNSTGPNASTTPTTPATPSFSDVSANAWFAAPVAWAVEKGITSGTSKTTFSPNSTCNNSQILTFLWRAAGKPSASDADFSDVASNAYYADAANWARSKDMVSGDKLSPNEPCTRASAVMFIWQAMGKPTASKAASFTDVPANADYAAAVAWAVEKGVTQGTGNDTFSPGTICTRAQIVAFLQRAYA